jgi:hypothetical protein
MFMTIQQLQTINLYMQVFPGLCNGNAAQTVLNLEEGDAILAQTPTVNVIKGVISYALLDRTGENG